MMQNDSRPTPYALRLMNLAWPVLLVIGVSVAVTLPLILLAGADPGAALYSLIVEPFTSRITTIEILVKATPLLLTGVAVAVAFSAGYYNIGAEGQLLAGAVCAAWLGPLLKGVPALVGIPVMAIGGMLAGALWAAIPALLKTRVQIDEVVTTLLSNSIMGFIVSGLLNGPWRNPITKMPQSPNIAASAEFPTLLANARLHIGFVIGLLVVIGFGWLMRRTALGLQFRAVGQGKAAARFLGVNVTRITLIAALLSGAIAGLAGAGEVAGVQHRLIDEVGAGFGTAGVIVATLGGFSAWGVALSALFIGLIENGAQELSRSLGVPSYLSSIVQATLLIAVLVAVYMRARRT